ncbi:molybdate transport system ATP-binding protein [Agrococcus jejuensis]|uniref:Molybdate transport system ATP-binding protein n=2 Tax=Agrococcus jejuensis TaxID=399736 RepID=A0A1G8GS68_9MICO|nr:molybdate transport system ATP-binding protein [Agrococcus jejuensis]
MTAAALDAHVVVARREFTLDAAIRVDAGEVVAVMGPSGAGKSTLLGALAGLVRPTGGRIRLGDAVLDDGTRRGHVAPMHRGVVLLGQDPRLFPHLTALENVAFALHVGGSRGARARADAATWLERVGLGGAGDRRPDRLSGGQQQRVALARALAAAPQALLLDEPLTSLDPETAADIRSVLAEQVRATGSTTVVVTHDAIDAVTLADRLVVVEGGRIVQQGAVRVVLGAPATRFAAAIAGVNRLEGVARGGGWASAAGDVALPAVDGARVDAAVQEGQPLVAVFAPSAVDVRTRVDASADDASAWPARVARLEATLGGVRVVADAHGQLVSAELAVSHAADLGLAPGVAVTLSVDPRAVRLLAA